jgi:hypothetical protein
MFSYILVSTLCCGRAIFSPSFEVTVVTSPCTHPCVTSFVLLVSPGFPPVCIRLRALQVPFAIVCQTCVYCNPRPVILIVILLYMRIALCRPLSLFVSLVPRLCLVFEFQPTDLGGVELARKCRPACPGSVYRSSIPLHLHVYVPSARRSHTPTPPLPPPFSNVLVPHCCDIMEVYAVALSSFPHHPPTPPPPPPHPPPPSPPSPAFVWFSNSNRQIWEA